ncbi:MAG: peptidase family [Phenylobacterium sp.]|nr:peptidase family [Phenylobacterium sp.]
MGRVLALAAALMLSAVLTWVAVQPPRPQPASAPASAFSAARAMTIVRAIGSTPHPIGSPANRAVRDDLVARMSALGLSPQVRPGEGLQQPKWLGGALVGGSVENIVGVLPGRDRAAPAVALMAHYDSVPGSPGAADDAAGVATALEAVRAIKARGVTARDVMVVITDGEEAGLLGANAFFRRDPLARRVGFLFNMEARGGGGRVQMFQTGEGNGGAIDLLRRTAARPQASSLTGFVYGQMPNDTDFTEARKAGDAGLNYAFMGRQFDYHSPTSTPANLEVGTLQDMGDQVLATAGAAAFAPALPPKTPDVVYGQVFGDLILAYPPAVGWLVLAAAAGLIALAVVRARRLEAFPWLDAVRGAGALIYAVACAIAVLHVARQATGAAVGFLEQRVLLAQVTRWEIALVLLGLGVMIFASAEAARGRRLTASLLPLAAGLGSCLLVQGVDKVGLGTGVVAALIALAVFSRRISRPGAWTGVLALGLVVAVLAQALAPPAAYVFAWPLALAALAAAATAMGARRGYAALAALALLTIIGLVWIGGLAHSAYLALDLPELLALPMFLAALLVWPLAQPEEGAPPARLVGPVLIAAGVVALLLVRLDPPWDARHPQVSYVVFHIDQDTGRAWRVDVAPRPTAWSSAALKADGGAIARYEHWASHGVDRAAPAPFVQAPAPSLTLEKSADGRLVLHAVAPPGARVLNLRLRPNTSVTAVSVNGVQARLLLKPGAWTRLTWAAAAPSIDLVLQPGGPGRLEVRYAATTERWPAGVAPLPKRPADVMPFDVSDSTLVTGSRQLAW